MSETLNTIYGDLAVSFEFSPLSKDSMMDLLKRALELDPDLAAQVDMKTCQLSFRNPYFFSGIDNNGSGFVVNLNESTRGDGPNFDSINVFRKNPDENDTITLTPLINGKSRPGMERLFSKQVYAGTMKNY